MARTWRQSREKVNLGRNEIARILLNHVGTHIIRLVDAVFHRDGSHANTSQKKKKKKRADHTVKAEGKNEARFYDTPSPPPPPYYEQ